MGRNLSKRRRRARRHLRRRALRLNPSGVGIVAVLLLGLAGIALLDGRRTQLDVDELMEYARTRPMDPVALVTMAGRLNRIVFLGDVYPAREPKHIAATAIEALARGPGLDAVVLEVSSELQPAIDAYLDSDPEDTSRLLAHPGTVQEHWGATSAYLSIYRTVWRLNRHLGPGRRIRVIAADLPGWPPPHAVPPATAAQRYGLRDAYMAERIDEELLVGRPGARILIFMGGYHGLGSGRAELKYDGGDPIAVIWLGTRLRERYPGEVYTIFVDAMPRPAARGVIQTQSSSRLFDLFRKHLPNVDAPFGLPVNERFGFLRDPFPELRDPGLSLAILPDGYRLQDLVDGYIFLGSGRRPTGPR